MLDSIQSIPAKKSLKASSEILFNTSVKSCSSRSFVAWLASSAASSGSSKDFSIVSAMEFQTVTHSIKANTKLMQCKFVNGNEKADNKPPQKLVTKQFVSNNAARHCVIRKMMTVKVNYR